MAVFHLFLIILIYFNVLLLAKSIFSLSFLYNLIYLYIKSPFFFFDILKDLN